MFDCLIHFIKKILPTEFCIYWLQFLLNPNQGHFCKRRTRFLVACMWLYKPLCPSVGRLVTLNFFYDFISLTSLLLPKWSCDLKYGPCPPAREFGSHVSGLVLFLFVHLQRPSERPSCSSEWRGYWLLHKMHVWVSQSTTHRSGGDAMWCACLIFSHLPMEALIENRIGSGGLAGYVRGRCLHGGSETKGRHRCSIRRSVVSGRCWWIGGLRSRC